MGDIHLIMVAGLVARRISFFIFPFVASAKYPTSSHARVLRQPLRARSISLFISYKSAAGRMNGHNRSGEVAAPISSLSEKQQAELEVEKKFPISEDPIAFDNLKETLTSLGFQITHEEEFVDWYFDLPGPNWHFSLRDIWIRYREKKTNMDSHMWGWKGVWQVKHGKPRGDKGASNNSDGMTVYQEYQGEDAKTLILEMLSNIKDGSTHQTLDDSYRDAQTLKCFESLCIPQLDGAEKLALFSMFKTFRSCWEIPETCDDDSNFRGLKVDIDRTDFGYAVGEVEAVFQSNGIDTQAVELGKEKIRNLVELLTYEQNKAFGESKEEANLTTMSMGKLEYYLKSNNEDHYDACVRAGVI